MEPLKFSGRADAYLEWGIYTGFVDYGTVQEREQEKHVGLLVQWRDDVGDHPLKHAPSSIRFASVYQEFQHAAISADSRWLTSDPQAQAFFGKAQRIELASPVSPGRGTDKFFTEGYYRGVSAADGVLLGCIDDGFPLANTAFFDGGTNRVARFWNQNDEDSVAGKPPGARGDDPEGTDFGYGRELLRPVHNEAALPTSANRSDESAYYECVRLRTLRRRATHGAHVLDVMAGPEPARARLPVSRDVYGGGDGSSSKPADHHTENSPASRAPIVLVQFPKYAIEDPSGRWLGRNVLDGLQYILQTAGSSAQAGVGIRHVVVNVSWGPQTGPRDGSSLLELAIDELVSRQQGRQLDIVLAAGNSRIARAHAEFEARAGCDELVWCVPPALESPSHLEIWWPVPVEANGAKITVTAPDGAVIKTAGEGIWAQAGSSTPLWGVTQVRCGTRMTALIALAPTFFRDRPGQAAPHGRWLISVEGNPTAGRVHVNVARTNHNMGARQNSRSSYLWDARYEEFRHSRQGRNGSPPPLSLVQCSSTLNGVATGQRTSVATGYRLADASAAAYASEGPCGQRDGPDLAYPTDESALLPGVKGGAVRSGTVERLTGTSTASPQFARDLADLGPLAEPTRPKDPRLGMGRR